MEITYFGHSCFNIKIGDDKVLFDPFISGNSLAKSIDINKIKSEYLLLSHGHGDHVGDTMEIVGNSSCRIITTYEVGTWLQTKGANNVVTMNHGGSIDLGFGMVKLVSAIHSSSMPDGSYGGKPCGFVIKTNEKTFYYSGDTALTYDMKLIAEQFNIDFAFLCLGDHFTMGIDDALRAADFVGTSKIIGMHYDSFPPIKIDHDQAKAKASAQSKELFLLDIGQTITF
jgi:L-ascorbate metabolism protein UlaG (beta-lactamase superfamily)